MTSTVDLTPRAKNLALALVGGALGVAILATIANSRTQDAMRSGNHDLATALTKGFERAFLVGACFALVGALLTLVLISSRDIRAHALDAQSEDAIPMPVAG